MRKNEKEMNLSQIYLLKNYYFRIYIQVNTIFSY